MRKALLITICVALFYCVEFILYNYVSRWFMPNLLLLAVVYFNMAFGIRYSIYTAVLAGILADSFSAGMFGINVFAFVFCAYMTTVLKKYFHYVASRQSRLVLTFFILAINITTMAFLQYMFATVDFVRAFKYVFVPEALSTLVVTSFVFAQLKRCVLKFSVSP